MIAAIPVSAARIAREAYSPEKTHEPDAGPGSTRRSVDFMPRRQLRLWFQLFMRRRGNVLPRPDPSLHLIGYDDSETAPKTPDLANRPRALLARTARDGCRHIVPGSYSACLEIFSSAPMQANVTRREDPPYETSGSGMPFVGIIPRTTLMLMKACTTIMLVMPTARKRPNMSWVRRAVRMPRHRKTAKSSTITSAPSNPTSSAVTAKM